MPQGHKGLQRYYTPVYYQFTPLQTCKDSHHFSVLEKGISLGIVSYLRGNGI
jgi:hypothetical protein